MRATTVKNAVLGLVLACGFAVSALAVRISFLSDDSYYLLASEKTTLIGALVHPMDLSMGWYRPVVALAWYAGSHLWGSNVWGYQLLIACLFCAILFMVYKTAAGISSINAGLISSAIYLLFFPLIISTWSKATLCYLFETLFSLLAIYFFIRFRKGRNTSLAVLTVAAGMLAFLSREAAISLFVILFLYVFFHLTGTQGKLRDRLKSLLSGNKIHLLIPALLGLAVTGLYLTINYVLLHNRNNVSLSAPGMLFNLATLVGTYGIFMNAPLIVSAAAIGTREKFRNTTIILLLTALTLSLAWVLTNLSSRGNIVVGVPEILLIGLSFFILAFSFIAAGPDEKFALALFAVPLLPCLVSVYIGYGYYFTSAAGLAIFIGMQLSKGRASSLINPELTGDPGNVKGRRLVSLVLVLLLIISLILKAQIIPFLGAYFDYTADASTNEHNIMVYIAENTPANATIYQADRDPLNVRLIVLGKEQRIEGLIYRLTRENMYRTSMLELYGRDNIRFAGLANLTSADPCSAGPAYLIDYNATGEDIKFAGNVTLEMQQSFVSGEDRAVFYKINSSNIQAPDPSVATSIDLQYP